MNQTVQADLVRASALGDELDKPEAQILAALMGSRTVNDGEMLVREGGPERTLFVLVAGQINVSNVRDGKEQVSYIMNKGECAGARSFVDAAPRRAALRGIGPATVYTLEPDRFETLIDSHPRIVYKVMRAMFRITHANLLRMNQETQQLTDYVTKTHGRY
jgi:CRP/FNR family transcriptional regulator, cyclic AMP receptor protein